MSDKKITIRVYLTNGNVYKYFVDTPDQARDHANEIVMFGYRSCNNEKKELTHFPPHRILKVKCVGEGISTEYPDTIEGT